MYLSQSHNNIKNNQDEHTGHYISPKSLKNKQVNPKGRDNKLEMTKIQSFSFFSLNNLNYAHT